MFTGSDYVEKQIIVFKLLISKVPTLSSTDFTTVAPNTFSISLLELSKSNFSSLASHFICIFNISRFPDHAHIRAWFSVELGAREHVRIPRCARHQPHYLLEEWPGIQCSHSPLSTRYFVSFLLCFHSHNLLNFVFSIYSPNIVHS